MKPISRESKGSMKPGQDLVMTGFAGQAGARIIAREKETELANWFSPDYIKEIQKAYNISIDSEWTEWGRCGVTEWEPVCEGGIYTALWNLSGAYMTGIEVGLHRIPVRQETIEVCERFDLNPYRLWSEGAVIFVTDRGSHLAEALQERGICAAVIGRVNPGIKREIYYGEVRGFLERPKADELEKIVPGFMKHKE